MDTDKIFAEQIANEYAPKDTSKVIALRKLDRKARMPASIFTYTCGIVGALILGVGMCLCLGAIGAATTATMVAGIVIGLVGIAMMLVNYPLYRKILNDGKKKYGTDIMQLAREICDG